MMTEENLEKLLSDPHVMEVVERAHASREMGATVYFKWTCRGCGERATVNKANTLTASFIHEDCGYLTRAEDGDLGLLTIFTPGRRGQ